MQQEIIQFVTQAIASGIVGGASYDGLKSILGSSYLKLESHFNNKQMLEFNKLLVSLLEDRNIESNIKTLISKNKIKNSFNMNINSEIDITVNKNKEIKNSLNKNINSKINVKQ